MANNPYGFSENHSTYMALLITFDTLDHEIFVSKLNYCGVRGTANKWFYSYLEKRKQFVIIDSVSSDTRIHKCGVPQGSILGPCCLFYMLITS